MLLSTFALIIRAVQSRSNGDQTARQWLPEPLMSPYRLRDYYIRNREAIFGAARSAGRHSEESSASPLLPNDSVLASLFLPFSEDAAAIIDFYGLSTPEDVIRAKLAALKPATDELVGRRWPRSEEEAVAKLRQTFSDSQTRLRNELKSALHSQATNPARVLASRTEHEIVDYATTYGTLLFREYGLSSNRYKFTSVELDRLVAHVPAFERAASWEIPDVARKVLVAEFGHSPIQDKDTSRGGISVADIVSLWSTHREHLIDLYRGSPETPASLTLTNNPAARRGEPSGRSDASAAVVTQGGVRDAVRSTTVVRWKFALKLIHRECRIRRTASVDSVAAFLRQFTPSGSAQSSMWSAALQVLQPYGVNVGTWFAAMQIIDVPVSAPRPTSSRTVSAIGDLQLRGLILQLMLSSESGKQGHRVAGLLERKLRYMLRPEAPSRYRKVARFAWSVVEDTPAALEAIPRGVLHAIRAMVSASSELDHEQQAEGSSTVSLK